MPAPRAGSGGGEEATPLMATPGQPPTPPPVVITRERALEGKSILADLGAEVVSVVWPVSLCMALTVWLVRVLGGGSNDAMTVAWASAAYSENPTDSTATKAWGAVANAAVFVLGVAAMTFALAAAFRRGFTRAIYAYLAWSGFSLFFFLGGDLAAQLAAVFAIPVDALTFSLALWNFAVGGVACLFLLPAAPLSARQAYCIFTGVATAYIFTHIPPWTTWALLGGMAVYDLYAVLAPGGPLKALVETAAARGEDIPALIYEGRSSRRGRGAAAAAPGGGGGSAQGLPLGVVGVVAASMADAAPGGSGRHGAEAAPPPPPPGAAAAPPSPTTPSHSPFPGLPDAIKLGLGDFIFYSVLVGRASMGDLIEAGAAYVGVIAGLGATLAALALRQHALPALPVSIALGAACTAAARWVVEPVVVPLAASMLYF